MPITAEVKEALRSADALVHAAYDLSLRSAVDIWRVNVEGTRRLLEVAVGADVSRIIVLSSMSAFDGTSQLYGRAKLDIEAITWDLAAFPFGQASYTARNLVEWLERCASSRPCQSCQSLLVGRACTQCGKIVS